LLFDKLDPHAFGSEFTDDATMRRRSSRLRARRSVECVTTMSPSGTKLSMAASCGRFTSVPEALSVNVRSTARSSSCRAVF
jgi:hypothetical protein